MNGNTKTHSWNGAGTILFVLLLLPTIATGVSVTWTVDPTASSVQLTIPDQPVNVTNIGTITVRMRDAGNNNAWTDAGGRRATVQGTILTDYTDGTSIRFVSGSHNLSALEQSSLRPNPADWAPATTNYSGTSTALAAYGARVRGTYTFFTFDVAFIAFRNVRFDVASEVVSLTSGGFAGNQTRFGILSATADTDGLELPLGLGQPVPDLVNAQMSPIVDTNSATGTIQNLGGSDRRLTYNISTPVLIDVQGMTLTGSAAGQIVAYGKILEQPTLRIWRVTADSVGVGWPTAATGFILEQNSALTTTGWATVTNTPAVVDNEQQVTIPVTATNAFYRLRNQ
jgi:hypothetical protein